MAKRKSGDERRAALRPVGREPLWYKDAIIYELRVGAFQDSDGDGIGDFLGLTARLGYLEDLGVTALWLLPFYPSPMRDDGYDIADYFNVHPDSGTLDDFKQFLAAAHRRNLKVITELVLNHTSDQHPWFQRARRAPPGHPHRDYYVWSDSPERYNDVRIIFQDYERSNWTWDPVANAYFWHRFFAHQPDLNFDNPVVRREVLRAVDFWLELGVDGLRLDAVPYLFEREGTSCENLPETHTFLRELRRHVDEKFADRMLLAEANQWPEDAVAYFGEGDECHMAFHFPVMPRLFMALHMEDRFPIVDIMAQTPVIPEACQWALFLRNHDELTLEMVTDEERDYMYRVYAHDARARLNLGIRRRLSPLLGKDRRRIELMTALLFSLPGTPILYYGDEIGMGDNIALGARNGGPTPMQWSSDRNAGFSRANPQRLYLPIIIDPTYHYETVNVEAQQDNPHSLLLWTRRLIALRKRYRAFGRGTIEFITPNNAKILAFLRCHGEERILVVANLSRFVEYVNLDLSALRGHVPVEVFGRRPFPAISDRPYFLTLGPHSFYWFELTAPRQPAPAPARDQGAAPLVVARDWTRVFTDERRSALADCLRRALPAQRGFAGKAGEITGLALREVLPLGNGGLEAALLLVRVEQERSTSDYVVPVAFVTGERGARLERDKPQAVFSALEVHSGATRESGVLVDGLVIDEVARALLELVRKGRSSKGEAGALVGLPGPDRRALAAAAGGELKPVLLSGEQSNSSVRFDQALVLKLLRRVTPGPSPEYELGRFLSAPEPFAHVAPIAGALEYRAGRQGAATIALVQPYVVNEGDAWQHTLDRLDQTLETVLMRSETAAEVPQPSRDLLRLINEEPQPTVLSLLGEQLESARLLGRRVAELHRALGRPTDDPAFVAEPFTTLYQRSLYQSLRNVATRTFTLLRDRQAELSGEPGERVAQLLGREKEILALGAGIVGRKLTGKRIRCHGDLHLGQVLFTGNDFVIIDLEGEPAATPGERRLKRSPLRDVAGMLRSFDYAAHTALKRARQKSLGQAKDRPRLVAWARFWRQWVSSAFLRAYLGAMSGSDLIPVGEADLSRTLRFWLMEKALYEVRYELDYRPDWLVIPVLGALELLDD